jgi:hypothetical protein
MNLMVHGTFNPTKSNSWIRRRVHGMAHAIRMSVMMAAPQRLDYLYGMNMYVVRANMNDPHYSVYVHIDVDVNKDDRKMIVRYLETRKNFHVELIVPQTDGTMAPCEPQSTSQTDPQPAM